MRRPALPRFGADDVPMEKPPPEAGGGAWALNAKPGVAGGAAAPKAGAAGAAPNAGAAGSGWRLLHRHVVGAEARQGGPADYQSQTAAARELVSLPTRA